MAKKVLAQHKRAAALMPAAVRPWARAPAVKPVITTGGAQEPSFGGPSAQSAGYGEYRSGTSKRHY